MLKQVPAANQVRVLALPLVGIEDGLYFCLLARLLQWKIEGKYRAL
jgi:hypothetical protein